MKNKRLLILTPVLLMSVIGCNQAGNPSDMNYEVKSVDVYTSKESKSKSLSIRFYESTPSVPYISVKDYYDEFFNVQLNLERKGNTYRYTNKNGNYLQFDIENDVFTNYDLIDFNNSPIFVEDTYKAFCKNEAVVKTPVKEKAISLKSYSIDLHGDSTGAYVPLTFLSSFTGGVAGVQVGYNGENIFFLDPKNSLGGGVKDIDYYGSLYKAPIEDLTTKRKEDMAKYNYGELCFIFDNLRGYTSQLFFGDYNLRTLGLNGLLEHYYPDVKTMLLSTDKANYYKGFRVLFEGLFDGGHTAELLSTTNEVIRSASADLSAYPALDKFTYDYATLYTNIMMRHATYAKTKQNIFTQYNSKENLGYYYKYDSATETAYVGFDNFKVDYISWNKYYTQGLKEADLPTTGDSFYNVRKGLYQAKTDGAKKVVLDLSTNGGGDSLALVGIAGLFHQAKANFDTNDICNDSKSSTPCLIDINLDGKFDDLDKQEAAKFNFQVAVLTSKLSFSCGNLLPSMLKSYGLKIVGERSGGGSCVVNVGITADGLTYYRSGAKCLSDPAGNNIDDGVPLDFEIEVKKTKVDPQYEVYSYDPSQFYDFVTISDYLNTLNA